MICANVYIYAVTSVYIHCFLIGMKDKYVSVLLLLTHLSPFCNYFLKFDMLVLKKIDV